MTTPAASVAASPLGGTVGFGGTSFAPAQTPGVMGTAQPAGAGQPLELPPLPIVPPRELHTRLQSLMVGKLSLRSVRPLLEDAKKSLIAVVDLAPLTQRPGGPSGQCAQDRSAVATMNDGAGVGLGRFQVTRAHKEAAIRLSDHFGWNEKLCLRLVVRAAPHSGGAVGDLAWSGFDLYTQDTIYSLHILCDLFRFRDNDAAASGDEVVAFIDKFCGELTEGGLSSNLLSSLGRLADLSIEPQLPARTQEFRREVRRLLASTLLQVYQFNLQQAKEALEIVDLLRRLSALGASDDHMRELATMVFFVLVYVLDQSHDLELEGAEVQGAATTSPLANEQFIKSFNDRIMETWPNPKFQGITAFVWGLFLKWHCERDPGATGKVVCPSTEEENIANVFRFALARCDCISVLLNDILGGPKPLVRSADKLVKELVPHIYCRMDEMLCQFLVPTERFQYVPFDLPNDHAILLMQLVAHVYSNLTEMGYPEYAEAFWGVSSGGSRVHGGHHYLKEAWENLRLDYALENFAFCKLFSAFLQMACALAHGEKNSTYAYGFFSHARGPHQLGWDSFFNLMQRILVRSRPGAPMMNHVQFSQVARPTPHAEGSYELNEAEVECLSAIMRLMRAVLLGGESTRHTLMEGSLDWRPLDMLLDLFLVAGGPPSLKADILRAITAFSHSPDVAVEVFRRVEESQILRTASPSVDHMNGPAPRGQAGAVSGDVRTELETKESRSETYPLTLAFTELLDRLLCTCMPADLGQGSRAPGFTPYMRYVRDTVFLQYDQRKYLNPDEKWSMAASSLELLCRILNQYHVDEADFTDTDIDVYGVRLRAHKSPCFELLVESLSRHGQSAQLLSRVLAILAESMDSYQRDIEGITKERERCILAGLSFVEAVLKKEDLILENALHLAGLKPPPEIFAHGISEILERNQQLFLCIAKYVCYKHNDEVCLRSIRIVSLLSSKDYLRSKIGRILTSDNQYSYIRDNYVRFLEMSRSLYVAPATAETGGPFHSAAGGEDEVVGDRDDNTAMNLGLEILDVMLTTLDAPAPNLAHVLLGFNLHGKIEDTDLLAKSGAQKTCMDSIMTLLDYPNFALSYPRFTQRAFELIYRLARDESTCKPTLNYLDKRYRMTDSVLAGGAESGSKLDSPFLVRHFKALDVHFSDRSPNDSTVVNYMVSRRAQMGYLLKTMAIEVLYSASMKQNTRHVQEIADAMFRRPTLFDSNVEDGGMASLVAPEQLKQKMIELLDGFEVARDHGTDAAFQDLKRCMNEYGFKSPLAQCMEVSDDRYCLGSGANQKQLSLPLLKAALVEEGNRLQFRGDDLQRVVLSVLEQAMHYKRLESLSHADRHCVAGWKDLIVVMVVNFGDILQLNSSFDRLLFELLDACISYLRAADPFIRECVCHVTSTILMKIRERSLRAEKLAQNEAANASRPIGYAGALSLSPQQCSLILAAIGEAVTRPDTTPEARLHLYTGVLNFLQFVLSTTASGTRSSDGNDSSDPASLDALRAVVYPSLERGDRRSFIEVLCRDAVLSGAHKLMALSTLYVIMSFDTQNAWLEAMSQRSYLHRFVSEFAVHDNDLVSCIDQQYPESLQALYCYEARVSLLVHIAQTSAGAEALLAHRVLPVLSSFTLLQRSRSRSAQPNYSMDIMSIIERQRMLMIPVLRLLLSIIVSTNRKHDVMVQCAGFLSAHGKVISSILHDENQSRSESCLTELRLIIAIYWHFACCGTLDALGGATKNHGLLVNLFLRYTSISDSERNNMARMAPQDDVAGTERIRAGLLDVACQASAYVARCNPKSFGVLFHPDVTATASSFGDVGAIQEDGSGRTLGDLLSVINSTCRLLESVLDADLDQAPGSARAASVLMQTLEHMMLVLWKHYAYFLQQGGGAESHDIVTGGMQLATSHYLKPKDKIAALRHNAIPLLKELDDVIQLLTFRQDKIRGNPEFIFALGRKLKELVK